MEFFLEHIFCFAQEAFTKAFVKHYSRISLVLVKGLKRTEIGNRVVHISVQLFSNEGLACQMVQEYNLLYTLIISLTHMIENTLLESSLEGESSHLLYTLIISLTKMIENTLLKSSLEGESSHLLYTLIENTLFNRELIRR